MRFMLLPDGLVQLLPAAFGLVRSRRAIGGQDVEIWTLAWHSEVAVPPLRKRPWTWRQVRYQVAYSPQVGFLTLDSLDADFVLTLDE